MSELERPAVGDELLMISKRRYRDEKGRLRAEPVVNRVQVKSVARYRVVVEPVGGSDKPWDLQEFDLRTGTAWSNIRSDRVGTYSGPYLYTEAGWALKQRENAAEDYLSESGVRPHQIRGSLRKAYAADPLGFANALRRFEGLEEI